MQFDVNELENTLKNYKETEREDDINLINIKLRETLKIVFDGLEEQIKNKYDNKYLLDNISKILKLSKIEDDISIVKLYKEKTYQLIRSHLKDAGKMIQRCIET